MINIEEFLKDKNEYLCLSGLTRTLELEIEKREEEWENLELDHWDTPGDTSIQASIDIVKRTMRELEENLTETKKSLKLLEIKYKDKEMNLLSEVSEGAYSKESFSDIDDDLEDINRKPSVVQSF